MPTAIDYMTVKATGEIGGATSATQMPAMAGVRQVKFKAQADNAGNAYVGLSGVTTPDGSDDETTGFGLAAGEETPWLPAGNLDEFYRICDNAGDDLTFIALH